MFNFVFACLFYDLLLYWHIPICQLLWNDVWHQKGGTWHKIVTHNIISANQKNKYFAYHWLHANAMFKETLSSILWEHQASFQASLDFLIVRALRLLRKILFLLASSATSTFTVSKHKNKACRFVIFYWHQHYS